MKTQHTNSLIRETSPYLLQHAHNPVDWHPWGQTALDLAKKENRPIFLSVGYSACHWCHVMEHESFEDEGVARLLNEYFVSIKVDREERPDIDDIYMTAVQVMTGQGGWPMSVFLTPEGEPFYAGTYFPREDRHGMTGFTTLVRQIGEYWRRNEKDVRARGQDLVGRLKQALEQAAPPAELPADLLKRSVLALEDDYDPMAGGFGGAPKFPASMSLDLYVDFLDAHPADPKSAKLCEHLLHSLRKMAQGGMYDQVGGGYHRYSTDGEWLVPHFEKMLYDNALLAKTHLEAARHGDGEFNRRIGREICDYVLREMTHAQGAFFSTTDADSEGLEGKFFLWSNEEVEAVLGKKDGEYFCDMFGLSTDPVGDAHFDGGTPPHDWFHHRIAHLEEPIERQLHQRGLTMAQLDDWRKKLWVAREKRVHPGRDEKVLASWNGLMSSAMVAAYRATGEGAYLGAAEKNLTFIWSSMQKDGRLKATWKDGDARHMGTLEDYANVMAAMLELHRVAGGPLWLDRARILADVVILHFSAGESRAFYYTADDADKLVVRSKNPYDNAVPAGNSVMAGNLLRLGILLGQPQYTKAAEGILKEYATPMLKTARGYARMIREAALLRSSREIVLLGADETLKKKALRALRPLDFFLTEKDSALSLLQGKTAKGGVAIMYICQNGACQAPVSGAEAIVAALEKL